MVGLVWFVTTMEELQKTPTGKNPDMLFIELAGNGRLALMKELIRIHSVDIHSFGDLAFRRAVKNRNLDVLKWLIELEPVRGKINIHTDIHQLVWKTITDGHLDILTWLIDLEPTHGQLGIHIHGHSTFQLAVKNKCLNVLEWLIKTEPKHGRIDVHEYNEYAFRRAAKLGHLPVLKWLIGLEPTHGQIDIHAYNDDAFRSVVADGHVSISKLLVETSGRYRFDLRNPEHRGVVSLGGIELMRWWAVSVIKRTVVGWLTRRNRRKMLSVCTDLSAVPPGYGFLYGRFSWFSGIEYQRGLERFTEAVQLQ